MLNSKLHGCAGKCAVCDNGQFELIFIEQSPTEPESELIQRYYMKGQKQRRKGSMQINSHNKVLKFCGFH